MRGAGAAWAILALTLIAVVPRTTAALQTARANASSDVDFDVDDDFVPYQGDRFDVFDWNLCKGLAKQYSGNVLLSPISVKIALVLLFEGAQGQTAHELSGTMQLPFGRPATRDRFSTILRSLQATSPEYILDVGTRLVIDNSIAPRQRYSAIVKTFYSTDVITRNLSDTHNAATEINDWVSNITHGEIKRMISDEESIKDTVMLVMNALYFKGSWRTPFPMNKTRNGQFFTGVDKSVNVPLMNTVGRFYYSESTELDAKILRLPYLGHKYAMYIVLPNARAGLDQLMQNVNPFILRKHMWLMEDIPVDVTIPKFKFDFTSHLENVLRELGIRDIFDNTASLPGIARGKEFSRRLIVSDIVQKAGLDVNEFGTVAHAATEVVIGNKIADMEFHATHPFIFFIEDETTGTVVFVGKVTNPLETSGQVLSPDLPSRFGGETPDQTPAPGENRTAAVH